MNMHLTNITPTTDYEKENFWELNPQLKIMLPFHKLYKRDKSKNKDISSKEMWCIFFMEEVDEEFNKFAKVKFEERAKILKETFYMIDLNDEVIQECIEGYNTYMLTLVARAFKEEQKSMIDRGEIIRSTPYTFDEYERDNKDRIIYAGGRPVVRKGTAKDLDAIRKNSVAIYEAYEKIEKKFLDEKGTLRIHGGRSETSREKGKALLELDRSKMVLE